MDCCPGVTKIQEKLSWWERQQCGKDASIGTSTAFEDYQTLYMNNINVFAIINVNGSKASTHHITLSFITQEHPQLLVRFEKLGQWERWYHGEDAFKCTSTAYEDCQKLSICLHTEVGVIMNQSRALILYNVVVSAQDYPGFLLSNIQGAWPYVHPQHKKVVKHLTYVWHWCGCHNEWVQSLNHCIMLWFVALPRVTLDWQ